MGKIADSKADVVFRNAKPKDKDYLIADGRGLGLLVTIEGGKRWVFRYRFGGKAKKMGLRKGYPDCGVAEARRQAEEFRQSLARGEDPGEVRKVTQEAARAQAKVQEVDSRRRATTFEKVAREWHAKDAGNLNPKYASSNLRRLEANVFPYLGDRPIDEIKPRDLLDPLRKVAQRGAKESALRIQSICSQVFRYAVACGLIESDPSRDLRGALPKADNGHFAALTDPQDVAKLLRAMDGYQGHTIVRAALQFGALTFVRPGNLAHAEWNEFHDLDNPEKAEWRIPGEKMKVKTRRPFIVPLAPQTVLLLEDLRRLTGRKPWVFPSIRPGKGPISNNTVNAALRTLGYTTEEMTGHGFRAMARTLCHEVLHFAPEVSEEQLAHAKSGPLGDAYDRTTHMPERRRLMREWADYLEQLRREPLTATMGS